MQRFSSINEMKFALLFQHQEKWLNLSNQIYVIKLKCSLWLFVKFPQPSEVGNEKHISERASQSYFQRKTEEIKGPEILLCRHMAYVYDSVNKGKPGIAMAEANFQNWTCKWASSGSLIQSGAIRFIYLTTINIPSKQYSCNN